jgi:hypothetical protein
LSQSIQQNAILAENWIKPGNFRIIFSYGGPNEVAKAIFSNWWVKSGYFPEWLYKRITDYDRNKAKEFKAINANAGCLVWSTGFSLKAEQFHWEIVKRNIKEFHEEGMKIIVYISLTNAFWKELFLNEPESEKWLQKDHEGKPVPYGAVRYEDGISGPQITRYLMCCNNPEWRKYQKIRIKAAIDAGVDGFFWDNNFHYCYCDICKEKFRLYTKKKLGKEYEMPEPLPKTSFGEPEPEPTIKLSKIKEQTTMKDEVFKGIPLSHPKAQLYFAMAQFGYDSILDMLMDLYNYARSLKPDVIWSNNGHLRPYIYDSANIPLSEDHKGSSYKDGLFRTYAHIVKWLYADSQGKKLFLINCRGRIEVFEAMCFGGMTYTSLDKEVNDYLERHGALYRNVQTYAPVGMICPEMDYSVYSKTQFFDLFYRYNVQYDIIPIEKWSYFDFSKYHVLIMRNVIFTSDEFNNTLRQYVENGGTLIATYLSSLYDDKWKRRRDYGLADVFGYSYRESNRPKRVENLYGNGKAIFYPDPLELLIENEPDGKLSQMILEDVKSNIKDPIVEVQAPIGIVVNVMHSEAGQVVHILNYGYEADPVRNIKIHLTQPKGRKIVVIPFGNREYTMEGNIDKKGLTFTLPEIHMYTACLIM